MSTTAKNCSWKGTSFQHECDDTDVRATNSIDVRSKDFPDVSIFDELVVDDWFHLEQMDDNLWWMRVGDLVVSVSIEDGKTVVSYHRDGEDSDEVIDLDNVS